MNLTLSKIGFLALRPLLYHWFGTHDLVLLSTLVLLVLYLTCVLFRCDFGYKGATCKETVSPNPTHLLENFEGPGLPIGATIDHIEGAVLGYKCDVLSSGKALVLNKDGHREFVTGELNTTDNM